MPKLTTPEEDIAIRAEWAAGLPIDGKPMTLRRLGEKHYLSKATISNIVHGYPYGGVQGHKAGKSGSPNFHMRVFKILQSNLSHFQERVASERDKAIENGNTALLEALTTVSAFVADVMTLPPAEVNDALKRAQLMAEQDGWRRLADNNLTGYTDARTRWLMLAEIMGERQKDPWCDVIDQTSARHRSNSLRFDGVVRSGNNMVHIPQYAENPRNQMDAGSWTNIKDIIQKRTNPRGRSGNNGRWAKDRRAMAGIIEAMQIGLSLCQLEERGYGALNTLHRYYCLWFRSCVFRDMRDMAVEGSPLHSILPELDEMERYRIAVDPERPPRLQDLTRRTGRTEPRQTKE